MHPKECCGLIWADKNNLSQIREVELAHNIAVDPYKFFEIDSKALFAAARKNRTGNKKLIGYFHSHPNGLKQPSEHDAAAADDQMIWLIIAGEEVSAWQCSGYGALHGMFNPILLEIIKY